MNPKFQKPAETLQEDERLGLCGKIPFPLSFKQHGLDRVVRLRTVDSTKYAHHKK